MPSGDEWGLLGRYAQQRDESAFAEVVRRYVDLVYSAALRRVGDRQLAEDVTQGVFFILAQKAKSLRPGGPLSAWLLTTVRYAAANAIRMERRRRQHEDAAAATRPELLAGAGRVHPTRRTYWCGTNWPPNWTTRCSRSRGATAAPCCCDT